MIPELDSNPSNPLSFSFTPSQDGFDAEYYFYHPLGKQHYVPIDNLVEGQHYLKMMVEYTERSHENDDDDNCSNYSFDTNVSLDEYEEDTYTLPVYFTIPNELCDENGNLLSEYYIPTDYSIVQLDEFTKPWKTRSRCNGSGVCNLYDSYTHIQIKYVEIE